MAQGGGLLDQRQYVYQSLFGSDDEEDERIPSPAVEDGVKVGEPSSAVDSKPQQAESTGRFILRLKFRRIPGTDVYKNLTNLEKQQAAEIQQSKVEAAEIQTSKTEAEFQTSKIEAAAKRKHCDAFESQEKGKQRVAKKQGSKCAKKKHGDSARARIEWKSRHLSVRRPKLLPGLF